MENNTNIEISEEKELIEELQKQGELISYKTSPSTTNIDKALLSFNKEVESIEKGEVNPFFKNFYCSLDQIISYIRPLLAKNDLYLQQFPIYGGEGMLSVKTIIKHVSGEFIMSDSMPIRFGKTAQDFGGTNTYLRRYCLGSVLGLSFEKDDDANTNKSAIESQDKSSTNTSSTTPVRRGRR